MADAGNPFRPGLGLDPPVLAGREAALGAAEGLLDALERLDAGVPVVLSGLVGTGRTASTGGSSPRPGRNGLPASAIVAL